MKRSYQNADSQQGGGGNGAARKQKRGREERRFSPSDSGSHQDSDTDEYGHFSTQKEGQLIDNGRYEVMDELGKGTFGKVFRCRDLKHKDVVAIKVIRKISRYIDSAKIEASILNDVYEKQKHNKTKYCVKLFSHWKLDGHYCLVFERLGISLYDVIKKNNYMRMPMSSLVWISQQILEALDFLKESVRLIHTDLKMENVMFLECPMETETVTKKGKQYEISVPSRKQIKLIDFGGATYEKDAKRTSIINTRQYRGPEVTLELGWSFPSDIWSVGCLVAELYSGDLLFQTHDELEHLAMMEQLVGPFPKHMSERAVDRRKYFHSDDGSVKADSLKDEESKRFVRKTRSIDEYFTLSPNDSDSGILELVRGLLKLDPDRRLTAKEALQQHFFSSSLPEENHYSS